jgi:hypothetical protein
MLLQLMRRQVLLLQLLHPLHATQMQTPPVRHTALLYQQ